MSEGEAIGVVGVGWVGLVTAACFAELGHDVHAMDVDEAKIAALSAGEVPIHEPGLAELVSRNAERLHFTTSMDEVLDSARLLFVCVDTPPTYSGDADLSRVRAVVDSLPERGEFALVMKSTVPAGTGASIQRDVPGPRVRVVSRVPQGGQRGRGLHASRPRRHRRRSRTTTGRAMPSRRSTSRSAASWCAPTSRARR